MRTISLEDDLLEERDTRVRASDGCLLSWRRHDQLTKRQYERWRRDHFRTSDDRMFVSVVTVLADGIMRDIVPEDTVFHTDDPLWWFKPLCLA